jgi:hypothetical protein
VTAQSISLVAQDGLLSIVNSGNCGGIRLAAPGSIQIETPFVTVKSVDFLEEGGCFSVDAAGMNPALTLSAIGENSKGSVAINNSGVAASFIGPEASAAVSLNLGAGIFGAVVGGEGLFSKLTMLPDEVIIEVGTTILSISDEGLTITAGETVVSITSAGINEASGDTSRELNSEGHNFTAAETILNVGSAGVSLEAATLNLEVDGAKEENASSATASFDSAGSIESAMTTIE